MSMFGYLTVTVCKNKDECCTTGELHGFTTSQVSYFTGDDIGECFGFDMGSTDLFDQVSMEVMHFGKESTIVFICRAKQYDCRTVIFRGPLEKDIFVILLG